MKTRGFNFGAGPSMLPEPVLLEAQAELLNWNGTDMSILEIGHRTPEFQELMRDAEADFREILNITEDYEVLFLGGAARTQFAMVPMNFINEEQQGAYLVSGIWSALAYEEAVKTKRAYCVASSEQHGYKQIPEQKDWHVRENTAYLFYTPNETINGTRYSNTPSIPGIPLVADMTSCILSEPLNIQDYALIFAGAQKNISAAGLTMVIIQREWLTNSHPKLIGTMFDYRTHASNHSLYATPPVFNCYLAAKMFKWVKQQGGVQALYELNCKKSALLYDYIDASPFYHATVHPNSRSLVNVCFSLNRQELEQTFIDQARNQGLYALKGHRAVGGLRASLYNAMPIAGVQALIDFMQAFFEEYQ